MDEKEMDAVLKEIKEKVREDAAAEAAEEAGEPVPEKETEKEEKKPGSGALDWAQALVFSVIPVVLIFAFLARTIGVEGSSMFPTLEEGDRVIISNLFYSPKQGDIVVLSKRTELFPDPLIKRVIATEGQTIRFDFDSGAVWVDGELLQEEYIAEPTLKPEDLQSGVTYTVPENCVFVMGDNRNRSSDSRKSEIGMVDERHIMGRVLVRIFPFGKFGMVGKG